MHDLHFVAQLVGIDKRNLHAHVVGGLNFLSGAHDGDVEQADVAHVAVELGVDLRQVGVEGVIAGQDFRNDQFGVVRNARLGPEGHADVVGLAAGGDHARGDGLQFHDDVGAELVGLELERVVGCVLVLVDDVDLLDDLGLDGFVLGAVFGRVDDVHEHRVVNGGNRVGRDAHLDVLGGFDLVAVCVQEADVDGGHALDGDGALDGRVVLDGGFDLVGDVIELVGVVDLLDFHRSASGEGPFGCLDHDGCGYAVVFVAQLFLELLRRMGGNAGGSIACGACRVV